MDDLSHVKAGDEVAHHGRFASAHVTIRKVDRVTATMIHIGGMRFRKDGSEITRNTRSRTRITLPTPELRDRAEHAALLRWVVSLSDASNRPTLEQCRAMREAYKAHAPVRAAAAMGGEA